VPNPNELTPENSALVLIDEQPGIAMLTQSIDKASLINNVAALASVAHALAIPTVLTTIDAHGGLLENPIFPEVAAVFPDLVPIDRSTTNAWSDPDVRSAVEATGRRRLVMAGIQTEVCLAQTALGALRDGFEVFVVSDCSAASTAEAHQDAKTRMSMAGARPINWIAVTAEWAPDHAVSGAAELLAVRSTRGGAGAMWSTLNQAQVGTAVPAG
jgi:nicotinamidase-related amidase